MRGLRPTVRTLAGVGLSLLLLPSVGFAADPGDVVISELMIDPGAGAPEWLELYNPGTEDVTLDGCTLSDSGSAVHALDGLTVPASTYVIVAEQDCVAFEAGGICVTPTALETGDLSLNNDSDSVTIDCAGVVIDTVSYTWDDLEGDCVGADSCSANVAPDALFAADNDAWPDAWCIPPSSTFVLNVNGVAMISTPGRPNDCPEPGAACGAGDVVFTELMIAPTTSSREWFEVTSTRKDGCDLQGCVLREGPFADATFEPTHEDWRTHTIDAPGNSLFVGDEDYVLFATAADTVVGDPDDPQETVFIDADYRYSSIGLANGEEAWLHLSCGEVVVDSVPYDWSRFEAGCSDGAACSVNLLPERETADGNDVLTDWCLATDDTLWSSSSGLPFVGTPDAPGACLVRPWPTEGDVVFTELMIAPDSGSTGTTIPEWFELTSLVSTGVDLLGCRIARTRLVEGTEDEYAPTSTSNELIFGEDDVDAGSILAGATQVWSRNLCLDGTEVPDAGCAREERLYAGIEFSNSESERIELYCPDGAGGEVLVDRAGYDIANFAQRGAHSVQIDPNDGDVVSLNDDARNWCEASFLDCYATNGEAQCNYGTPGEATPCLTGQITPPPSGKPGCRCSVDAPLDGRVGVLVLMMMLVGRWRRSRE